jgi:DNA-binding NarL/FixJ family response regulator
VIRVVLVDDQELVRAGLRALLEHDGDIEVVGEAGSGHTAIGTVRATRPDVVLMDLRMPDGDGIDATRRIAADPLLSPARVLVLTTFDADTDIVAAIRAGAAGYLLKDVPSGELRGAVRTVAEGGNLLAPAVTRQVMRRIATGPEPPSRDPRLDLLTDREFAVLARVGLGESNAEIGRALFISPATARTHVGRLLAKLDLRDRTQLAVLAHRCGIVPPPEVG